MDPLEVLYNIIGKRPTEADTPTISVVHAAATVDLKPECLVENIDFGELSLEQFVEQKQRQKEEERKSKRYVDVQTIEQCMFCGS